MTKNWEDKFPELEECDIQEGRQPGDEPQEDQDKMTNMEDDGFHVDLVEEQIGKLAYVLRLKGIDTLVAIIFDAALTDHIREMWPEAALWSSAAFERFMDDTKHLPTEARRKALAGACLVKTTMGGTYQGIEVTKGGNK